MTDSQQTPSPQGGTTSSRIGDRPPVDDSQPTTMPTRELPYTAAAFAEDGTGQTTINDDDPRAALELIRDAIVLLDSGVCQTALRRGSYEVYISRAPDDWEEPSNLALHLCCVSETIVPNPRDPGTTVQSTVTLWIKPVRAARKMVAQHFEAGFAGLTERKERAFGYEWDEHGEIKEPQQNETQATQEGAR